MSLVTSWRRLRLDELPAERWANGGGVTRTLAVAAQETAVQRAWRVSVADIPVDAEFSRWIGWRRASLLLEGGPLVLQADDGEHLRFAALEAAHHYDGGRRWSARLGGPPARFLNAMSQGQGPVLAISVLCAPPLLQAFDQVMLVLRGSARVFARSSTAEHQQLGPGEALCRIGADLPSPQLEGSLDFLAALVGFVQADPVLRTSTQLPKLP